MNAVQMVMAGMWMQDPDSISSGNSRLLMIFVGMVALALIVQAIALIIMAVGAVKAQKRAMEIVEEVKLKVMPIIDSTQDLIRDTSPKVRVMTDNFVETSHIVRAKAQDFDVTATDVNAKTRAQVARVDGMVSSVLDTTADVTDSIRRGVKVPIREVTGIVNGIKAGLDVLIGRAKGFGNGRGSAPRDRDPGW